jgi:predicted ATPase
MFVFALTPEYEANRLPIQGQNAQHGDWRFILQRADRTVTLRPEKKGARALQTEVEPIITALPLVKYQPATEFEATRWFFDLLTQRAVFFDPKWSDLRKPSPPGQPDALISSGANLPWLAQHLQRTDPERFGMWVRHVGVALPPVTDIDIEEHPDNHHAWFKVAYEGGFSVTSSGLSEGTLRILALTLLPYLPEPPALTVVEEPENSIHPQAIEAILDALRSMWGEQVWISTHSPVVLATRKVSEVVITRLGRDGAATAVCGPDHPRLAQWRGGLDLGTLFATGVFE